MCLRERNGECRRTCAHEASFAGQAPCLRLLLERDAGLVHELTDSQGTCLHCCARSAAGSAACASLLVACSAQVNAVDRWGETALHLAACKGHTELLAVLLSAGADALRLSEVSVSPLHLAARYGHTECCRLLLARCLDVHTAVSLFSEEGLAPVHEAALHGKVSLSLSLAPSLSNACFCVRVYLFLCASVCRSLCVLSLSLCVCVSLYLSSFSY